MRRLRLTTIRTTEMFANMKKLRTFQPRPLPAVILKNGQLARTPQQIGDRWKEHAQETHLGSDVTMAELVAKADSTAAWLAGADRHRDVTPAHGEIQRLFSIVYKRKDFGEDSLPPKLFAEPSDIVADVLHPVMCKASLKLCAPTQRRGGMLTYCSRRRPPS